MDINNRMNKKRGYWAMMQSNCVICCETRSKFPGRWKAEKLEKLRRWLHVTVFFFSSISSGLCNYVDIEGVLIEKTRVMFSNYQVKLSVDNHRNDFACFFYHTKLASFKLSTIFWDFFLCFHFRRLESFFTAAANAINHVKSEQEEKQQFRWKESFKSIIWSWGLV